MRRSVPEEKKEEKKEKGEEKGEDLSSGFEGMTMATSNYVLNG